LLRVGQSYGALSCLVGSSIALRWCCLREIVGGCKVLLAVSIASGKVVWGAVVLGRRAILGWTTTGIALVLSSRCSLPRCLISIDAKELLSNLLRDVKRLSGSFSGARNVVCK
jgi:hypothetical protein